MPIAARTNHAGHASSPPATAYPAALREEDTMPATPYAAFVAAHEAPCSRTRLAIGRTGLRRVLVHYARIVVTAIIRAFGRRS